MARIGELLFTQEQDQATCNAPDYEPEESGDVDEVTGVWSDAEGASHSCED